jgi:ribosome-associated protein
MATIPITPRLAIDDSTIDETFIHASGPGGQNVNKVASAVQLRFDARNAGLPFEMHARLEALAGSKLTRDGAIIITARTHRDQQRNRADARERLIELLQKAAITPKKRKATKVPRSARARRVEHKKRHSALKRRRSGPLAD